MGLTDPAVASAQTRGRDENSSWNNSRRSSFSEGIDLSNIDGIMATKAHLYGLSTGPANEHAPGSITTMRRAAVHCERCHLFKDAIQTVFGEGPRDAPVIFVGEQPGDHEDLAGKPFVGPAGKLFDRALGEAGLDRSRVYVTNSVKHFKYELRGKRRIHKKPNAGEISACRWWLKGEIAAINPELVVALGATAARALAERSLSVLKARGVYEFPGQSGFITVHPSFLLRLMRKPGDDMAKREYRAFVRDLSRIGEIVPAICA
jgi:uracil-DNA glycosylase family protein